MSHPVQRALGPAVPEGPAELRASRRGHHETWHGRAIGVPVPRSHVTRDVLHRALEFVECDMLIRSNGLYLWAINEIVGICLHRIS
jgi:hypothetical protein